VALFTSCLVDQFYPQVGESLVTVLRRLGVEVTYDPALKLWTAGRSGLSKTVLSINRGNHG
jgi:Fe-S oxidoreductase